MENRRPGLVGWHRGRSVAFGARPATVGTPALPLPGPVTLNKSSQLSASVTSTVSWGHGTSQPVPLPRAHLWVLGGSTPASPRPKEEEGGWGSLQRPKLPATEQGAGSGASPTASPPDSLAPEHGDEWTGSPGPARSHAWGTPRAPADSGPSALAAGAVLASIRSQLRTAAPPSSADRPFPSSQAPIAETGKLRLSGAATGQRA